MCIYLLRLPLITFNKMPSSVAGSVAKSDKRPPSIAASAKRKPRAPQAVAPAPARAQPKAKGVATPSEAEAVTPAASTGSGRGARLAKKADAKRPVEDQDVLAKFGAAIARRSPVEHAVRHMYEGLRTVGDAGYKQHIYISKCKTFKKHKNN